MKNQTSKGLYCAIRRLLELQRIPMEINRSHETLKGYNFDDLSRLNMQGISTQIPAKDNVLPTSSRLRVK